MSTPWIHEASLVEGASAPPRDNGELVFAAPWEARVFAMAVALVERLDLTWDEFRSSLIDHIGRAPHRPYYENWAAALESMIIRLGLTTHEALDAAMPEERAPL